MKKEEIIKKLKEIGLHEDFIERNPGEIIGKEYYLDSWKLVLTEDEYEKVKDRIIWACGACCGFGSLVEYREENRIIIEGIPCSCHTGWSLSLKLV